MRVHEQRSQSLQQWESHQQYSGMQLQDNAGPPTRCGPSTIACQAFRADAVQMGLKRAHEWHGCKASRALRVQSLGDRFSGRDVHVGRMQKREGVLALPGGLEHELQGAGWVERTASWEMSVHIPLKSIRQRESAQEGAESAVLVHTCMQKPSSYTLCT
ncbi:hypothetical protein B0H10DRAFT_1942195 [Mycena sp. CBHHK59/15]|nr:hypothetical protein B0H10DRAFT_1942195 [Mycena sp. CBHHK59/15]